MVALKVHTPWFVDNFSSGYNGDVVERSSVGHRAFCHLVTVPPGVSGDRRAFWGAVSTGPGAVCGVAVWLCMPGLVENEGPTRQNHCRLLDSCRLPQFDVWFMRAVEDSSLSVV